MKGNYIGSGIGIPISDQASVEERSPSVTASATVSGVGRSIAQTKFTDLGQAGINYQTASWTSAKFTVAATASTSGKGNPYFSATGTSAGNATTFADGETTGQGAFNVTSSATVSGTSAAQADVVGTAAGTSEVISVTKTISDAVLNVAGTSTASAVGQGLRLYVNAINDKTYGNTTTNRSQNDTITTTRTYGSNLTEAA